MGWKTTFIDKGNKDEQLIKATKECLGNKGKQFKIMSEAYEIEQVFKFSQNYHPAQ